MDNGEIVARDKNGGYKVDVPVLPVGMWDDDCEEGGGGGMDVEIGEGQGGGGGIGAGGVGGVGGTGGIGGREKESMFFSRRGYSSL